MSRSLRTLRLVIPAFALATAACAASTDAPEEATSSTEDALTRPIARGGAGTGSGLGGVITKVVSPFLTIDQIEPAVEQRPMAVHFTFSNPTPTTLNGWVGGEIDPVAHELASYTTYYATDWQITNLGPGQSQSGVISIAAPRAETQTGVKVFFYDHTILVGEFPAAGPHLYEASGRTDVAARYSLSLDMLNIHRTRAKYTDTDYVQLAVNYQGSDLSPATYRLGDVQDGAHALNGYVESKPFDSIPGVSPSPTANFLVLNNGAAQEDEVRVVLDDISMITSKILSAVYPTYAAVFTAGNQITQQINGLIQDCNGVAATSDIAPITSSDLEVQTRSSDIALIAGYDGDKLGGVYASPVVCGMAPYYDVTWTWRRHRDPNDQLAFTPINPHVWPGGHVKLSLNASTPGVEWSLAGNFKQSTIGQDGTFYADKALLVGDQVQVVAMVNGKATTAYVNVVPMPTLVGRLPGLTQYQ